MAKYKRNPISTAITSVAWVSNDPELKRTQVDEKTKGSLGVIFTDGSSAFYPDKSLQEYREFVDAASKGTHYNFFVRES